MTISFNGIPNNLRVPFLYAEFDSSNAQQGAGTQPFKLLVLGQKTSSGSATANVPVRVTNEAQAISLFGQGSFLHNMLKKVFKNNKVTPCTVIPQADNGAGVAATGTLTVTGPATADGTISLYVGGVLVEVGVVSGDAQNTIAAAINTAIGDNPDLPVTGGVSTNVVTLTCRHKGLLGNAIDIRLNYQDGEALPAGVAVAIVAMASGTTAPVLTSAISAMAETQYNVIACPYNDATSLSAVEAELLDRWGPVRQNDGVAFTAKDDTNANLITFGDGRNSKHVSCAGVYKALSPSYEIAAAYAAVAAYYGNIDPARPFTGLPLIGIVAPAESDEFTLEERNLLLFDGIATLRTDASGLLCIDRAITMYQENSSGADDVAYLDLNTLLTLSYIRWDWRSYMLNKYPRHKLADDGTRFGAGQAVITPKIGKAEAIAKFREWEELGLVENADQFKRDLIVERNATDRNRLDFMLPPDLINQALVFGTQIGFLL